ncbi:DUF4248 domain-containing protein [Bacteroides sp. 519]|uniref:DUF4248 domain-containing protein n=1 Tax=Bacteroides sp. 519 TaxID=2302937 RepID=UPI0013D0C467|nr:DUF4248 domain-containing protein [Bacteroides sp. 519]NDV58068.1 DUF4248 domain-containing protein [Bacteroides sp. 519]
MNEHIKVYSKTELALLYLPDMKPATARRNLREWIDANKELTGELEKSGYRRNNTRFTPHQVSLIFKYLGEP